ncbi:MAG: TonB-dependent receptor, partial [Sphingobacteriales bacterium]
MRSRNILLTLLIFATFTFSAFIAEDPFNTIIKAFQDFSTNYPQEKVHIHSDRDIYEAGDNIWLKAYIVNAERNELSTLSKVLYIEFIDSKDQLIEKLVIGVVGGKAQGGIPLPQMLEEG